MLKNADRCHFYKLYIMHSDISDANQSKIKQIVSMFSNASIEFINMNNKLIKYEKFLKYPVEILYKLILASQFPNFDKMIITDVDVVFEGDISDEFLNFTTDEYFAGVKYTQQLNHAPFSLNIKDSNCHFIVGAGYLILNLKKCVKMIWKKNFLII